MVCLCYDFRNRLQLSLYFCFNLLIWMALSHCLSMCVLCCVSIIYYGVPSWCCNTLSLVMWCMLLDSDPTLYSLCVCTCLCVYHSFLYVVFCLHVLCIGVILSLCGFGLATSPSFVDTHYVCCLLYYVDAFSVWVYVCMLISTHTLCGPFTSLCMPHFFV